MIPYARRPKINKIKCFCHVSWKCIFSKSFGKLKKSQPEGFYIQSSSLMRFFHTKYKHSGKNSILELNKRSRRMWKLRWCSDVRSEWNSKQIFSHISELRLKIFLLNIKKTHFMILKGQNTLLAIINIISFTVTYSNRISHISQNIQYSTWFTFTDFTGESEISSTNTFT